MSRLLDHPVALCNIVRRVALAAGAATLEFFDEAGFPDAQEKTDGSPVTDADQAAERIILDGLRDIIPHMPVIAEEAYYSGACAAEAAAIEAGAHEYFWLVDALDGTRAFIEGDPDYTVNIALIKSGVPILGVIYAPAHGELYAGAGAGTAIRWHEDTGRDKDIHVRKPAAAGLNVMASVRHGDAAQLDEYLSAFKVARLTRRSSSLKFCMIAAGKADLYPRFGQTSEWDVAAGDAILRAAGGSVTTLAGDDFTYGHAARKFKNPPFIAGPKL